MAEILQILTLITQNMPRFQTYSAPAATRIALPTLSAQERIDSPQAKQTHTLQTVYSSIAQAAQTVVPCTVQVPSNEFLLKKQHSQHAKQRTPKEEGFSSITRITANVLFPAHAVLDAHATL